ncbi:amidase [Arthrobacter castelli]|uniref:amidase n=1 Tax=Arthrobacter castelli TaxID=271431 RepID=UPI000426B7F5|nr:amidase [Arthrobacter castelli]
MTEPFELSATAALGMFRSKALSPVEMMTSVIDRIGDVNSDINALTETMFDDAMAAAKAAEDHYVRGEYDGGTAVGRAPRQAAGRAGAGQASGDALLGLPVAVKEKHGIAGHTLSQGLLAHADYVADRDHPLVERIRRGGGIIHARTTSPEFSCATVTQSPIWGVTRNPWNRDCSPGGSSGGSAAALAAGMTPLATASDIAGSTRIPAAFTGTVGYKGPYGRIPGMPPLSMDPYRGDGPMARTVADTALLTNVMAGTHPLDHSSVPAPELLPLEFGPVEGMRIALCIRLGDYPVEPEIERNTRRVAAALKATGVVVEEVELPWSTQTIREVTMTHFGNILGPAMEELTAGTRDQLAPYTRRFMADAKSAAERHTFWEGFAAEAKMQAELAAAMAGFDALLCPTSAVASLDAEGEYLDGIQVGGTHLQHYWEAHMTLPFNVANRCPVLAVPGGFTDHGMPTGVQIVGHPYDDHTVFRVGAAIEQAAPWPL